jgi:subfamily B ATP-binding cassette protein MsbA
LAQVAVLLGLCAWLDFSLFLLAFAALPLVVLPLGRFKRAIRKVAKNSLGSLAALNTLLAETFSNLSIVKAYGMQARLQHRFGAENARFMSAMRRSLFLRGAVSPFTEYLGILGAALCIFVGAPAVAKTPALAQHLLSFLASFLLLYQPLRALSAAFTQLSIGKVAWGRFMELMQAPQLSMEGEAALPLQEALRFENVSLRFADGRMGLQGLGLSVPKGQKTALVGPTGAGKSSMLSLILGFAKATRGQVLWDEKPLEALALPSLRKQLAWVPQEPLLLSGTVQENICLGQEGVEAEALWEALRLAGAEEFVREKGGLQAEVGERGALLSGGQRQRLCIARAMLQNPSLLLLDEVTSALDADSEAAVLRGLEALMRGRTVLMVAHRLSTVKEADWIVVLDEGRVVEEGRHAELLSKGGLYARLWKAQALTGA